VFSVRSIFGTVSECFLKNFILTPYFFGTKKLPFVKISSYKTNFWHKSSFLQIPIFGAKKPFYFANFFEKRSPKNKIFL
jgi:hypothetical protein